MKAFVAGHSGLVGSALVRALKAEGHQLITANKSELDLRNQGAVSTFIEKHRPDWVFLSAAVVGGIQANMSRPKDFLLDNLKIQNNVIESSYSAGVKKLLFFGSNCMYPKLAPQPFKESSLLTNAFEPTNEFYALAKIAGVKLCQAFNQQFGTDFLCVVPTTLYGPNDNYDSQNAHVLPMLMRRFHEAKLKGLSEVVLWGSGKPTREFLHSDDLAQACLMLMNHHSSSELAPMINIGSGFEISIYDLALALKEVIGLKANIIMDPTKPDGMMKKALDSQRIFQLNWRPKIHFLDGLKQTYLDFTSNPNTRM